MYSIWAFSLRINTGNSREMAIALACPGDFTDISEQIDEELGDLPVCLVHGQNIADADFAILGASPDYLLIGFQRFDAQGVQIDSNLNNNLNGQQVIAARNWFSSKWPNIPMRILSEIAGGKSRQQAAKDIVKVIRRKEQQES